MPFDGFLKLTHLSFALPMFSAKASNTLYNFAIISSSLGVGVNEQINAAPEMTHGIILKTVINMPTNCIPDDTSSIILPLCNYLNYLCFLYLLVAAAIFLGCFECCLPLALSFLFFAVVAAYSLADKAFIAFSGRYLSPVSEDFLPLLVLHFCLVQLFKLL